MGVTTSCDKDHKIDNSNVPLDHISRLPEDCLTNIIALTSVQDACRSSTVCTAFHAAADSDFVWEHFLPSDLPSILDRVEMHAPLLSSKKKFYFHLCDHGVFLDDGTKRLILDRQSGGKIYFLSARALSITPPDSARTLSIPWGHTRPNWQWLPHQDSRFLVVAELLNVYRFEVWGMLDRKELSPKTNYAAYFVYKIAEYSHGLEDPIYEAIISVDGIHKSKKYVRLKPNSGTMFYRHVRLPQVRTDGWMEIKLGEFYNDDETGIVVMELSEIKKLRLKRGLLVEGIEVRPELPN